MIRAIARRLVAGFGNDVAIYDSPVRQGLEEPCFLIELVDASRRSMLAGRYRMTRHVDVLYFPKTQGDTAEMYAVAERLLDMLEVIELDDGTTLRGTQTRYEIVDEVLHFMARYDDFLLRPSAETDMEELTARVGVEQGVGDGDG